jgi:hypothetical protein
VELYDPQGRWVSTIYTGPERQGRYQFSLPDGIGRKRLANGIYFVKMTGDGATIARKVILVR